MKTWWPTVRDMLLFFGGLAGIANETFAQDVERPTLLLLFAAMCGLPAFLRQDERGKDDDGGSGGGS